MLDNIVCKSGFKVWSSAHLSYTSLYTIVPRLLSCLHNKHIFEKFDPIVLSFCKFGTYIFCLGRQIRMYIKLLLNCFVFCHVYLFHLWHYSLILCLLFYLPCYFENPKCVYFFTVFLPMWFHAFLTCFTLLCFCLYHLYLTMPVFVRITKNQFSWCWNILV